VAVRVGARRGNGYLLMLPLAALGDHAGWRKPGEEPTNRKYRTRAKVAHFDAEDRWASFSSMPRGERQEAQPERYA